jgi:hypothetical protein
VPDSAAVIVFAAVIASVSEGFWTLVANSRTSFVLAELRPVSLIFTIAMLFTS